MPLGHAGDLEVTDLAGGQVLADFHGHVAFDNLAVVQVHLHLQIGGTDGRHDLMGMVLPVEKKPGHIARVDGLDQHVAPAAGGQLGSPAQIGHVQGLQFFTRLTFGHQAGHQVNARAVECVGIVQCHL